MHEQDRQEPMSSLRRELLVAACVARGFASNSAHRAGKYDRHQNRVCDVVELVDFALRWMFRQPAFMPDRWLGGYVTDVFAEEDALIVKLSTEWIGQSMLGGSTAWWCVPMMLRDAWMSQGGAEIRFTLDNNGVHILPDDAPIQDLLRVCSEEGTRRMESTLQVMRRYQEIAGAAQAS